MYASFALFVAAPVGALAAVTVATTTIQAPPGDVAAGATVAVACRAEGDTTTGGMQGTVVTTIDRIDVAVTGGTVTPARLSGAVSRPCSSGTGTCSWLEGSAAWSTPAAPGALTATCTVAYTSQGQFGGPRTGTVASSASLTTVASATLPPVASAMGGPGEVVAGSASTFDLVASDPNTPPLPLSFTWSATGGALRAAGPSASWTAPSTSGVYTIVATVSNGATSVQSSKSVNVVLAARQAALPLALGAPRRLCADGSGAVFAVDGQQGERGRVTLVTARGEVRGVAVLPEPALAVASGAGLLWVTTTRGNVYKVDPASGRTMGKLALAGGPFAKPLGIAYDAANMALWVADAEAGRVRVVRPDGATLAVIDSAGGAPLGDPVDVAVDAAAGRAWVLRGSAKPESALVAGEPIAAARFLHAFDLAGGYLASYVSSGGGAGQVTRAGGVTVGPAGRVYVSDVFQGTVQVVDGAGLPVGTIGAFGGGEGELLNPMGLALLANGDLAVANTSRGRIERYGTGAPLPTCAGDSDCDGLPDAWERANHLDPLWAGDALLDLDGDGLTNREELALGTDPRNADTDGDGFSDGDEALAGFDPRNPADHRPAVAVSGPPESPPGLVRLSATTSGPGACAVRWAQKAGPSVTLRGASTGSPSFVARTAAAYELEAVATCGGAVSEPSRLRVVVTNVPPVADPGRIVVVSPGSAVRLDAAASSDANADALSFTWDQALGPPVTGAQAGGVLTARPRRAGLYVFQLTASDRAGATGTAEVPVLVAGRRVPTAIGAARPVRSEAGDTLFLDASASLASDEAHFSWRQVAGPEVALVGADRPVASFVAPAAGRYTFEVSVREGKVLSPAARVEAFVAEPGRPLPAVTAAAPSVVAVNTPARLEASASGTAPVYGWRQLSGPAAGLTDAGSATATAVPFAPGFYVFEVSVQDGDAEARPARVAFEARAGGRAIPVARAQALTRGEVWAGQLVLLDGRASSGATRFRWTQVEGPWVTLGAQAAVTTFRPRVAGRYAFELEVDDGAVRSAPSRVAVDVGRAADGREDGDDGGDEDADDAEGVR